MSEKKRIVWCVGTWPEDNYADFKVTSVKPGESDEDALKRAVEFYGTDQTYYIKEDEND